MAKSSAANTVLASLSHSRKLDPSEFSATNMSGCSLDSKDEEDDGCVAITTGLSIFLDLYLDAIVILVQGFK